MVQALAIASFLALIAFSTAKSCPGFCTKDFENCTTNYGKIVGYCANEMACCDTVAGVTGSCGSTFKRHNVTYFKSPHHPQNSSGDLICDFSLKLSETSIAIRLDFLQFESDEMSYGQGMTCDSDLFFIRGFESWTPPPRCGKLTGYSTIIDRHGPQTRDLKTLHLLALMSSPAYAWHIRITQIFEVKISDGSQKPLSSSDDEEETELAAKVDDGTSRDENFDRRFIKLSQTDDDSEINKNPKIGSIVNGVETSILSVPWQASLRMMYTTQQFELEAIQEAIGENCSLSEGMHFCGGSIVGSRHILTAAHCFLGTSKTQPMTDLTLVKVILGDTNRCNDDNSSDYNSSQYDIEAVTFHYAYDTGNVGNDVALVKLKQEIVFKENIKAIPLASVETPYVEGQRALVSGWGMTELGEEPVLPQPDALLSNDHFTIQNETNCQRFLEEGFGREAEAVQSHVKYDGYFAGVFCTGSMPSHKEGFTGQGDSGGSLVIRNNDTEEYVQLGIVSFALPFKPNMTEHNAVQIMPGGRQCKVSDEEVDFFQSVPYFRHWIDLALMD